MDAVVDCVGSAVALAVSGVAREKDKACIVTGAGTADLTGAQCSPNTVHYAYDTWMLAKSTGEAMVKAGGDTWFFVSADYAFGHAIERDTSAFVRAAGGRVLGSARHPFPGTTDFSSFLVAAQASGARCWASPMPGTTPPTPSSRRPSSGWRGAACGWRRW